MANGWQPVAVSWIEACLIDYEGQLPSFLRSKCNVQKKVHVLRQKVPALAICTSIRQCDFAHSLEGPLFKKTFLGTSLIHTSCISAGGVCSCTETPNWP